MVTRDVLKWCCCNYVWTSFLEIEIHGVAFFQVDVGLFSTKEKEKNDGCCLVALMETRNGKTKKKCKKGNLKSL